MAVDLNVVVKSLKNWFVEVYESIKLLSTDF